MSAPGKFSSGVYRRRTCHLFFRPETPAKASSKNDALRWSAKFSRLAPNRKTSGIRFGFLKRHCASTTASKYWLSPVCNQNQRAIFYSQSLKRFLYGALLKCAKKSAGPGQKFHGVHLFNSSHIKSFFSVNPAFQLAVVLTASAIHISVSGARDAFKRSLSFRVKWCRAYPHFFHAKWNTLHVSTNTPSKSKIAPWYMSVSPFIRARVLFLFP